MESALKKKPVVTALALFAALLWGVGYSCTKKGYELFSIAKEDIFDKFVFAGSRFVLAGLISLGLAWLVARKLPKFPVKKTGGVLLFSFFQTFLQYLTLYIALGYMSSAKSSILNQTGVFVLILLSHLIYKSDKFSAVKALGCVVGFAGIVAVNFRGLNFEFTFLGEGFILLSSFSAAIGYIISKKLSVGEDPIALTGWQQFIGGALLLIVGLCAGGRLRFTAGLASVGMLLFLACSISGAYVLWSLLLKYNEVSTVTVYKFAVPIFGVIASVVILREKSIDLVTVLSMILVSIGIFLVNFAPRLTAILAARKLKKQTASDSPVSPDVEPQDEPEDTHPEELQPVCDKEDSQ